MANRSLGFISSLNFQNNFGPDHDIYWKWAFDRLLSKKIEPPKKFLEPNHVWKSPRPCYWALKGPVQSETGFKKIYSKNQTLNKLCIEWSQTLTNVWASNNFHFHPIQMLFNVRVLENYFLGGAGLSSGQPVKRPCYWALQGPVQPVRACKPSSTLAFFPGSAPAAGWPASRSGGRSRSWSAAWTATWSAAPAPSTARRSGSGSSRSSGGTGRRTWGRGRTRQKRL